MKHLFIILSTIMVFPALANIDASNDSPTCDESVLNASNGTANLEINWEPNVIPLRWYSGNTLLPVENNDDTCTYDGALNIPATPPEREGYDFAGWRVRQTYDFTQLRTDLNGTERWAIRLHGSNDVCRHAFGDGTAGNVPCTAYPEFYKELQRSEWKVKFDWGDIYGSSYCSAKSGNTNGSRWDKDSSNWKATYDELESASGDKIYCWCQVTGYKPNGGDMVYGPSSSTVWLYINERNNEAVCAQQCAQDCSFYVSNSGNFRPAAFGVTQ